MNRRYMDHTNLDSDRLAVYLRDLAAHLEDGGGVSSFESGVDSESEDIAEVSLSMTFRPPTDSELANIDVYEGSP